MPAALATLVVAFACGSSSIHAVKTAGLHVRWAVLLVVLLAAAGAAWSRWSSARRRPGLGSIRFGALTGAFLGLAFLSTTWSVAPRLTFERAVSLGLLFALGALLAYATEDSRAARRRALGGLAVGAVAVGVTGVVMVGVDRSDAVQRSTPITPWRFRGFTENPNTISVLAAVVLPIIGLLILTSREQRHRLLWIVGGALLLGSTVAAESRGGLIAGVAGLAVVCLASVRPLRRLALALVTLAAILVGGIELRVASQPGQAPFVSAIPPVPVVTPGHATGKGGTKGGIGPHVKIIRLPTRTYQLPAEQDEIGNPILSRKAVSLAGSGRLAEWKGVLKQAEQRPLVGYGFGTEERVFVDRWYYFQGGTAENSYLGLMLQLGALGTLLFCSLGAVLVVAAIRRLRRVPLNERGELAAELGVLVAAAALMTIQSYIYSVGNVASATAWIAVFMLGTIALGGDQDARLA